ncbi:endonuclease MutS2 [Orenia marismortui]|uniref:Endonuclease MutS2 n=1 Tax=Orenia marismortui TaxID=46469 RepID=A0A4R8GM80_9FIRM|nr:endonuclease MutS2 [Orenia marismortui]TDX46792.1 DNA mismatch repair protein MutS2 [Orenia marismortui]
MDKHALNVLEFNKIKDQLKEHITSKLTMKFIDTLEPKTEIDYIQDRQEEVSQAKKIIIREERIPLGGIYDIRSSLSKVEKDIVIYGDELLNILNTLVTGHRLKKYFSNLLDEDNEYYRIIKISQGISYFKELERSIKKAIDNRGEVKDGASSKLRDIRRNIRNISDGIKDKLNSIINSSRYQKYMQESVITIRDDRYVVPIKSEYQHQFPGIVHDQSSSGQTLFIEPMAVVKLNNKLRQLVAQEEEEVYRILKDLSMQVKESLYDIKNTVQVLAILDFIFAKAKYSIEINASEPLLNQDGYINLIKARHPLLTGDVVPTNIYIGDKFNTLVITGPNTGGKTVTLKTVGLLTLMAQSGLHIPALSGSKVGVYQKIYSDIGDEQSIEQSLSTFSSHMNQIIKIIEEVNEESLVLLDELGAGTDPAEGAALAMSLLDYLYEKGAKTIATTHYSELKTYAYTNEGIENSSVEFDVETLQPTYNLQMGLPGSSNAFQIASKLGLRKEIIDRASDLLARDDVEFDKVIKEIEQERKEYNSKKVEAESINQNVKKLKEDYEAKLKDFEERKEKELKEAYREANKIIKRAQEKADQIIEGLKEKKKASDREIEEARSGLRQERKGIKNEESKLKEDARANREVPDLKVGDKVKIISYNKKGEVIDLFPDKKEAVVQAGIMKINIDLRDLEKIKGKDKGDKNYPKVNISHIKANKTKNISPKINLIGLRAVEAKSKLEKYLDDVLLSNLNQIEIIHGKGTGVLRELVHALLDNYPSVSEYRLGRPKEGGIGVTFVNFK